MFERLGKLVLAYIIFTLLFTDVAHLKDPSIELVHQQWEDLGRWGRAVADYVDNKLIPAAGDLDNNKNLADVIIEKVTEDK